MRERVLGVSTFRGGIQTGNRKRPRQTENAASYTRTCPESDVVCVSTVSVSERRLKQIDGLFQQEMPGLPWARLECHAETWRVSRGCSEFIFPVGEPKSGSMGCGAFFILGRKERATSFFQKRYNFTRQFAEDIVPVDLPC